MASDPDRSRAAGEPLLCYRASLRAAFTEYQRSTGLTHDFERRNAIFDFGKREADAVMVAGSGRSGTTWLGNVIAAMTSARMIFEPLLLDQDNEIAMLKTTARFNDAPVDRFLYIRPDKGEDSAYFASLRRILRGDIVNEICDYDTAPGFYCRRVIKEIRGNLLLAYMARTWPGVKIIQILRDPFQVINSQLFAQRNRRWGFGLDVAYLLSQPDLVGDWLAPFAAPMREASTHAQKLAHRWCIETMVPFWQGLEAHGNVLLIRYEDLLQGTSAWTRISHFLVGHDWPVDALQRARATDSFTRFSGFDPNKLDQLSTADIADIHRIIALYGAEPFAGDERVRRAATAQR